MNTQLSFGDAVAFETPMLAVLIVDSAEKKDEEPRPQILSSSNPFDAATRTFLTSGEFKAGLGEIALLHAPEGIRERRLLLVGLGKAKDVSLDRIRKGAGTAMRAAKSRKVRQIAILLPDTQFSPALAARAVVEGAEIGEPDWDTYRSDRKDQSVEELTIIAAPGALQADIQRGFDEGVIIASAQNFTRSLVNEPGNVLTPTVLGQRAKAMCDQAGLKCEVYSSEKIQELKMEAFWAVAKGSAQPPALIVMTYDPEAAPADSAPVLGLVGK